MTRFTDRELAQEPAELQAGDRVRVVSEGLAGGVRVGVAVREPAEDWSKPAPGWSVAVNTRHERDLWEARRGDGYGGYFDFETDAIAWTWAQRDAQQAGKGGES